MIDKERMLEHLESFPRRVLEGFDLAKDIRVEKPIKRIVAVGMGGSGVSGLLLRSYLKDKPYVEPVQSDELPPGVDQETLAFLVSYSGETRETLDAYREAQRKFCKILAITSGGKLERLAAADSKVRLKIPEGLPPRAALPYLFFPMLRVLQNAELIPDQRDVVMSLAKVLQNEEYRQRGEELASELKDRVTVLYATPFMAPAAYRMKCQLNENAKCPAFVNVFPELLHNEVEGFQNTRADFHIIMLREDSLAGPMSRDFKVVKRVLKARCKVTELVFSEKDRLSQLFSAVHLGDWASYFLAIKCDTDPTPTPVISEIKRHGPVV